MRILIANDGLDDAGGVESYLRSVVPALERRGHQTVRLHRWDGPGRPSGCAGATQGGATIAVRDGALPEALTHVREWRPDVIFSHNMGDLDVETGLTGIAPVVKFMHGYFGTCAGGQKMFALPTAQPCDRCFGPACLVLYLPRKCGQMSATRLLRHYRWAGRQRDLFGAYAGIVVASTHMKREYVRNGADMGKVHVNPLFPTESDGTLSAEVGATGPTGAPTVAFLGRMTKLKGGDLLVRATAIANRRLREPIALVMAGDGPERLGWGQLAGTLGVSCTFTGWVSGGRRDDVLRSAHLLAVPSTWPEPFGLVGLEAAQAGVPSIAFDVGGIGEWLEDGRNGYLLRASHLSPERFAEGLVRAFSAPEEMQRARWGAVEVARQMSLLRHVERLEPVLAHARLTVRAATAPVALTG